MSSVYSFAISEEVLPQVMELGEGQWVSANPCSRVKGFSSISDYEAMILEPEQTLLVLESLKEPESTLLLLIAVTGLRMSEALGLGWMNILFEKGLIVFASYKLRGRKPGVGSMIVEDYLRPAAIKAGVITVDQQGTIFDIVGTEVKRFGFHTFRHSLAFSDG